jgi:hypothetical protein
MWILFAALAGITAVSLIIYNQWMKTPQVDAQGIPES